MEIIFIIFILIIIFIVIEYNQFTMLRNKVKHSNSSIDVYLNQRFDLIPNLVECVKGYAKYEESVYSNIAKLRSEYSNEKSKNLKKASELNSKCNSLLAVGENNPNLQASEQFVGLQKTLEKMESQLQAARRVYNGDVTLYNTAISTFPSNIFALIFGFKQEDLFEIEEYKKENINIDL